MTTNYPTGEGVLRGTGYHGSVLCEEFAYMQHESESFRNGKPILRACEAAKKCDKCHFAWARYRIGYQLRCTPCLLIFNGNDVVEPEYVSIVGPVPPKPGSAVKMVRLFTEPEQEKK